jgi:hypothetical protein
MVVFALVAVFSAVVIALAVLGFAFTLLWAVGSKPPSCPTDSPLPTSENSVKRKLDFGELPFHALG